jgi:hypothetical protein
LARIVHTVGFSFTHPFYGLCPKIQNSSKKWLKNYSKISLTFTSLGEENCSFGLR